MSIKRIILALSLFVFGWAYNANAQQNLSDLPPDIVAFSSDRAEVAVTEVETGQLTTTLSWHVINFTDEYTLTLDRAEGSTWVSVLAKDELLSSVGNRLVEIRPPLNFTPPTYRLAILDQNQQLVAQRVLVIPYTETDQQPVIESFLTSAQSVSALELEEGAVHLPVSWLVTHRSPTSNLVFEQILEDGQAISVELWRPNVWVSSAGTGVVAPVLPDSEESIVLRLRVVDVISDEVYDEAQLTLPVVVEEVAAPTPTAIPIPTVISELETDDTTTGPAKVISFIAAPNPADPTGTVTLSWEVQGASRVNISWPTRSVSGDTGEGRVENELPPTGTLEVDLSPLWYFSSDVASFHLMAEDSNGRTLIDANNQVVSASVEVQLSTNMHINAFTANPPTAKRTESITLAWDVANASRIYIRSGLPENFDLYDNLEATGELQIVIPEDSYKTLDYELIAIDQNHVTLKERLTIPVACSYTPQLSDQCPFVQKEQFPLVYQAYEHGYMIWRSDTQMIYVLYDDGLFQSYGDSWVDGESVQIDETPPAGLIKPERGFGKLWLEYDSIREGLGWATTTEISYTTLLEEVMVWVWKRPTRELYFYFPDNRLIHTRNAEIQWEELE